VSAYNLAFVEGFRRWRGAFWLHRGSLTFKDPAV